MCVKDVQVAEDCLAVIKNEVLKKLDMLFI